MVYAQHLKCCDHKGHVGSTPTPSTMYCVYILQSIKDKRTYVGYAKNIDIRFEEHMNGKVDATRNRRPFIILFIEESFDLATAKIRERYWKSGAGRRKLKTYFQCGFPPIKDGRGSLK